MASVLKLADVVVSGILIGKKFKKLSDSAKLIPCKLSKGSVYVQTPPVTLGSGINNADGSIVILDQLDLFNKVLDIDHSIQQRLLEKWPDIFSGVSDVFKSSITIRPDRSLTMKCHLLKQDSVIKAGLYNKYGENVLPDSLGPGQQVILILNLKGILLSKGVITVSWEIAQLKLYIPPQKRVSSKLRELSIVEESECENDDDIMMPYHDELPPKSSETPETPEPSETPEIIRSDISPAVTSPPKPDFCISDDYTEPSESGDPVSEDEVSESSRLGIILV